MGFSPGIRRRNGFLLLVLAASAVASPRAAGSQGDVRVPGPGARPLLFFACCNDGLDTMNRLFADSDVISSLRNLHAGVVVAIDDLSPQRAEMVRRLNDAGIPVVAGLSLPGDQGYYLNAANTLEAEARFTAFQQWTTQFGLRWSGVGLDIEPDIRDFEDLRGHRLRLAARLMVRYFEFGRVSRASQACGALIRRIQSQGYKVYTFQLPLIVAERRAHSTLFERLLGIVDVRGDDEAVMIFSGFNRSIGAAMIWALGPDAQSIAVACGVLNGNRLSWDEFTRDLIVAGHFSRMIGVYNLEGCAQLGYLSRLQSMDWGQSVTIPAAAVRRAERIRAISGVAIWLLELLPYIALAALVWFALAIRRIRLRRTRKRFPLGEST
jgi:hypothetical protein